MSSDECQHVHTCIVYMCDFTRVCKYVTFLTVKKTNKQIKTFFETKPGYKEQPGTPKSIRKKIIKINNQSSYYQNPRHINTHTHK